MMGSICAFLAVNALGIASACSCWKISRHSRPAARCFAGIALILLTGKSLLTHKPAWEADIFPWSWYIFLQGYWVFALGAVFFAAVASLLPEPRNRRAILILDGVVILVGAVSTSWMVYLPVVGEERQADARHQCMQSTGFTCAPSACVCALSYLGIDSTEREMAQLCLTRADGTTRFNTFRGLLLKLEGTAWRVHMIDEPPEMLCHERALAVIDFPEISHAVAVYGTGEGVILHDPLVRAPQRLSLADLRTRYGGVAVVIEPTVR